MYEVFEALLTDHTKGLPSWFAAISLQDSFESCSVNAILSTGLPFLATAAPLPLAEFTNRRNNLARALVAEGVDAFVVEPGYTFSYYGTGRTFVYARITADQKRQMHSKYQPSTMGTLGTGRASVPHGHTTTKDW